MAESPYEDVSNDSTVILDSDAITTSQLHSALWSAGANPGTKKRIPPVPNTTATVTHGEIDRVGGDGDQDTAETARNGRPVLESRRRRLRAYLRHNSEQICRDAAVILTWALAMTILFQTVELPRWVYYLITFVGVVGYAQVTTPWSRPYVSPDDFESTPATDRLQESKQRHE